MKPTHTIPREANAMVYAHGESITSVGRTVVEYASGALRHVKDADLTPYDPAAGLKVNDIVYIASGGGARPVLFLLAQEHGRIAYRETKNGASFITSDWSLEL